MRTFTPDTSWTVRPIGVVNSDRTDPIDDGWSQIPASIALLPPFDAAELVTRADGRLLRLSPPEPRSR